MLFDYYMESSMDQWRNHEHTQVINKPTLFFRRSHAENIKGTLCNKSISCLCKILLMVLCRGQKLTILQSIGIAKIPSGSSETHAGMRSSDLFVSLKVRHRSGDYLGCRLTAERRLDWTVSDCRFTLHLQDNGQGRMSCNVTVSSDVCSWIRTTHPHTPALGAACELAIARLA